jgi:hypothetical protein
LGEASYYTLTGELYPRLLEKLCEEPFNNNTSFDKLFFNDNELKEKIIANKENNLLSEIFKEVSDSLLETKKETWSSFKNKLKEKWKIRIDVDIFSEEERPNVPLTGPTYPLQQMMNSCASLFQKIMDATDDFLSKHCYHLSILNAAKLLDIFNPVVNDGIIIAEKLGKGKILKTTPSYALYYNSNLVDLSIISDSVAASFFDTLHFIQYYFQKNEEDLSNCLSRLTDFFSKEKKDGEFEETINHLISKMRNCSVEELKKAKEAFKLLFSCLAKLDNIYTEKFDLLFRELIMEGLFVEIYSFRKLVEANLNVIPNLKIKFKTANKDYELDALIPITKDMVIQCEYTLRGTLTNEKRKKFREVENIILNEMGLRCKTLVIGRECLCSFVSSDADLKMLSFSELSNKPKVISTILSLI